MPEIFKNRFIPIPEKLLSRPQDKRGYPILYTTAYVDGKPDFRVSDPTRREECAALKLCGICSQKLDYWIYFVTGELGARNRTFTDPPNHLECVEYALAVCPFLGGLQPEYTSIKQLDVIPDPAHQLTPPQKTGLYLTRGYKRVQIGGGNWLFLADAPKSIEWRIDRTKENAPQ